MSFLCEIRLLMGGLRIHRRLPNAAPLFSTAQLQLPKETPLVTPDKFTQTDFALAQPVRSSKLNELELEDPPPQSLLTPTTEDLSYYGSIQPTFNFAKYVNQSDTLKNFIKLGVNLHKIEKHPKNIDRFLQLDFERDVKKYITFLSDYIPPDCLGDYISKNPQILFQDIENLQTRINYLESKKFTIDMIKRILTKNPFWLMFK